jgi:hypothetical protein
MMMWCLCVCFFLINFELCDLFFFNFVEATEPLYILISYHLQYQHGGISEVGFTLAPFNVEYWSFVWW